MVNKKRVTLNILSAILVLSLGMILIQNINNVDAATTSVNTTSEANINVYFAITMSSNLSDKIDFGNINNTGQRYNATNINYNSNNQTAYFINVSADSSTPVNFTINASDFKSIGGTTMGVANEEFNYNVGTNSEAEPSETYTDLSTTPAEAGDANVGETVYYRFWLDVPAAQDAGTYTNNVTFKAESYFS